VGALQSAGQADARGEYLRRVLQISHDGVQKGAVFFQGESDGGVEQLVLAGEVVVEGAKADIRRLGDLLDAHVGPPLLGEKPLRGGDQRGPGACLAPIQAVGHLAVGPALSVDSHPHTLPIDHDDLFIGD
jgi:hypothetical protein